MKIVKVEQFKMKYFLDIRKIYIKSFPKKERFPIIILLLNIIRKNSEIFVMLENNDVCGFIYSINYQEMSFILYLAIASEKRSRGYGSYLLNWFLNHKKNNTIYLNIDEVNKKYKDNNTRIKRKSFYLNNGFYLADYLSVEYSGNFNILSNKKEFDINKYIKLDNKIGNWFFIKGSIVKINEGNKFKH